jgi:hypothetical protein
MLPSAALEKIDTGINKMTPQRTATLGDLLALRHLAVSILRAEGMGKDVCMLCNSDSERSDSENHHLMRYKIPRGAAHGQFDRNSVPWSSPLRRSFY